MRSNFSLGRNPRELEDEYRLFEELISTENRYHSLKFKQIVVDLKSKDEMKIMDAVTHLSTELSMAQEENLGAFQLDFLIPELINCLQMDNQEIMMHSAVSIMHILDIMPPASKILVNSGGIEVLCQKMQNFEYIDVAESSIKVLEKLSNEFGLAILNAGGMEIMLTMIDFFVSSTQKLIMSIISNIFKLVNSEVMLRDKILPVLPGILAYTQSDPSRQEIMHNMIARLSDRVVRVCGEDFEKKREYLQVIAQDKMVENFCVILNELVGSFDQSKLEQIESILKTLNKFCYFSLKLCMEAFNAGLIDVIDKLINILEGPASKENQLSTLGYETISLVNSILSLRANPHPLIGKIATHVGIKIAENCNVQGRLEMFRDHPHILQNILEKIGVRLPGIFENNSGTLFKYLVLISFQKLIEFCEKDLLSKHLDLQLVSNFISKLTTSNDIMVIALTLIIIELLLNKVPETYIILTREGVVDFIKALSSMTEASKLEVYSVVPKRYNPLEAFKQLTSSLRLASRTGAPGDFLSTFEAESQRLENLMQQLHSMKNPESSSDSAESKTLSSMEEGSPGKSPKSKKSSLHSLHSLQNIPKSQSSLEHKFLAGLNRRHQNQQPEEINLDDEVPSERTISQPVDKVTELRKEVANLALEIYNNMKEGVQKKTFPSLTPSTIINKLEEISLAFEQNQWNPSEFGQKYFQKYLDLITEFGRVTNYELKNSKILTHLLNFIFDDTLEPKPQQIAEQPVEGVKENSNQVLRKLRNRAVHKEEEKKTDSSAESEKMNTSEEKVHVEVGEQQCRTILGRIITFLYHFKKLKNKANEETHLQDFLRNLQEMLINSDQFSLDVARTYQEYENTLNSDMRFLAQRVKFKTQYRPAPEPKLDKKKGVNVMQKQKSMKMEEEKMFPSNADTQAELYNHKDSVFREVPMLALSVEQFGTLEVIEDYLLNKLNSKEDLHGGLFGRNINEFVTEKYENNQEAGSDEELSFNDREPMELDSTKNMASINKVPVINTKSKPPGGIPLQKSHSNIKTKYESRIMRNERRKWVDRLTGKEINFKKYLELKFYINGEEVDKNSTVYQIFSQHRPKNLPFMSGALGDIVVDYRLVAKKLDTFNFASETKEQYKQPAVLCLDHKSILQNLVSRIASLDIKASDSNIREIIRMIILIRELVDLDKRILSPSSPFNSLIIELSTKYGLGSLITAYKTESLQLVRRELIPRNEFTNKKISLVVSKYFNDPMSLAAGIIPELLKEICEKAPFLLDFKSKYHYYKNGCFHISRALYYIYQANKARLKDLESSRIGKIHRKKIRTSRENALENAVVNFETYGHKKSVLDFEFLEEEGTGLGPTLEYYAMVSTEMKNPDHNLWRDTVSNLLFPSPIDPCELRYPDPTKPNKRQSAPNKKRDFEKFQLVFRCVGAMLARAILDERIVDLPIHPVFWDVILGKPLYMEHITRIDPNLGETIQSLQEIVNRKQEIEKDQTLSLTEKNNKIKELKFKGCNIEDLALNFTFPGYNEIELIENGEDMPVTLSNLDQYVSIMTKYILEETVKSQVSAFREGFDKVIPLKNLGIFESDEIEYLICGGSRDEAWDKKTLEDNFVPAHGYNATSKSFKNFIKVVSEFDSEQKKAFLKFVTGAERLPFGGFKNLNPKLTVVKKQPNHNHEHPDQYLPSVMTCQNYVKLPDYSSVEVMQKRLLFSMKEGQNSFNLS